MAKATHYWTTASTHKSGLRTNHSIARLEQFAGREGSIADRLKALQLEADMPVYASREDRLKI
jgi:hypothetical protein